MAAPNGTDPKRAVLAENLRRLRTARKLSQGTLADRANLSRVGYRNIETGAAEPKPETLARLARALDVSLEDLVRPIRRLESVRFRKRKKMTSREQLLADVARWIENYAFVEELLDAREPFRLATLTKRRSKLLPVLAAERARKAMGLGTEESIRDICGLLEDNGIKVYTPQVASEGFFGLSLGPVDGGPAVVVNTWDRITVERWIFTAAHELGHLLLHPDAYDVDETEEREEEEREADLFASQFLMPDKVFQKEWQQARGLSFVQAVLKLKGIFRVSWKTVVFRIASTAPDPGRVWASFYGGYRRETGRKLGGTEEPDGLSADEFRQSPSPVARASEEPQHLPPGIFRQDRLGRLVRQAVEEDRITLSRAAELLEISTGEMRALARTWF